jgi:hypothetical protein
MAILWFVPVLFFTISGGMSSAAVAAGFRQCLRALSSYPKPPKPLELTPTHCIAPSAVEPIQQEKTLPRSC